MPARGRSHISRLSSHTWPVLLRWAAQWSSVFVGRVKQEGVLQGQGMGHQVWEGPDAEGALELTEGESSITTFNPAPQL